MATILQAGFPIAICRRNNHYQRLSYRLRMNKLIPLIVLAILAAPGLLSGQSRQARQAEPQTPWLDALIQKDPAALQRLWKVDHSSADTVLTVLLQQEAKDPQDPDWPYFLGIVCERTGEYEAAVQYYARTDSLRPSPPSD